MAGHLEILDISRKVMLQRYNRGLEKMLFEEQLRGFLGLHGGQERRRGDEKWTVRFAGELGTLTASLDWSLA